MRAAICTRFGEPFSIEEVALAPPREGEVRCAVRAVAICHSDLIFADGGWGGELPAVYGHEAAGEVLETGPGVAHLRPGDRVVITMLRHCGACPSCARGRQGSCEATFPLGDASPIRRADGPVGHGLGTGAFAEEVVVHASQLVPMGPDLAFETASLLACGVITGWGAVANSAAMPPGSDAVVVGTGGVGLNAVQAASIHEARRIIAIDLDDARLDAADRFGATHRINGRDADPVEAVREATDGRGADYVFVTVGAPSAFDRSYAMLAPGGASVLVGVAALGAVSSFDPLRLTSGSQRIIGSKLACDPGRDIPRLIRLHGEGRLKLDELVTGRFPFEGINEAVAAARSGRGLRNVVRIG